MKNISTKTVAAICALGMSVSAFAGNKDRAGQSGAPEMVINPWARSTGLFGLNTANIGGAEAMKCNIAGLAQDSSTDIGVSHGIYLTGSNISINNLALAQKIGEAGVIGVNLMSMSFGDITTTDFNNPDGYGSFHPTFLNVQVGYAKQFSSHINAGFSATYVSEQVSNINALGLAFDAGIQYVTGKRDNFHFGIGIRNIGTNMRFSGTGFSISGENPQNPLISGPTNTYPSDKFPMPTLLNIGLAYDIYLDEKHLANKEDMPKQRLTLLGNFTSNSFNNDYLGLGVEYGFRNMVMLRAAYRYEKSIGTENSTSMYQGLAAGATVQTRLGQSGPMLAIDYSFRPTQRPANGVHMLALRFTR